MLADLQAVRTFPYALVDAWGEAHVFYSDWVGEQASDSADHNAVLYTHGQGGRWTEPVDVLTSAHDSKEVRVGDLALDHVSGTLYVLWRDDRKLYLSSVPVADADLPRAWQSSVLFVGTTYWPSIAIDDRGAFHLVYESDSGPIFYRRSLDQAVTWSAPTLLAEPPTTLKAYAGLRLRADRDGNLHLVWEESDEASGWNPLAGWYMRSTDGGERWSEPYEVARSMPVEASMGWFNIGFGRGNECFLTWSRGVGSPDGRYYRRSLDSGTTWGEPQAMWNDGYGGQAGWSYVLLDSAKTLHFVTAAQNRETGIDSLHYAVWEEAHWSRPSLLLTRNCEFPHAGISNGNRIHVVCRSASPQAQVLYLEAHPDAPLIPAQKTAPATSLSVIEPHALGTGHESVPLPAGTDAQSPRVTQGAPIAPPGPRRTSLYSFLVGVLPAVAIVLAVVVVHVVRRR